MSLASLLPGCVFSFLLHTVVGDAPAFRILAPPFVCPKDKDAVINTPDNTVVTLQTDAGTDVTFTWKVRWYPLDAPTQRLTVALWRSTRELETQLNAAQAEPGVYIINNTQLLSGVNYIFNVTASSEDGESSEKSFNIDNVKGDQKLLLEGRSDMFSIILVGGQIAYADLEYILDAQVTSCYKTQDYFEPECIARYTTASSTSIFEILLNIFQAAADTTFIDHHEALININASKHYGIALFVWSVSNGDVIVNVSSARGSRLEIPPNSLLPGLTYNVLCQVYKHSDGEFITENELPFEVLHRDLAVDFNVDTLVISVDTPFTIKTDVSKIDYLKDQVAVSWKCTLNGAPFDDFIRDVDGTLTFSLGLPQTGEYLISVTITIHKTNMNVTSTARLITVEAYLPVIEVHKTTRTSNEGNIMHLQADISNVLPGCSITWYFLNEDCISPNATDTPRCTGNEYGIQISEPINFYSMEENFLNELTDYTNETGWKTVPVDIQASSGIAKIVAECECTKIVNCSTEGAVYADVRLRVNDKPEDGEVLVAPDTGTAMETVFRLSTIAPSDLDKPVRYTFYCDMGNNDSLVLGTYLEQLALETLLPYIEGGTSMWVEVCDSLGACSSGAPAVVELSPGEARTLDALVEDARALGTRCEIPWLQRLAVTALGTYLNAGQTDAHTKFTTALLETLQYVAECCIEQEAHKDRYTTFLQFLPKVGVDTSHIIS